MNIKENSFFCAHTNKIAPEISFFGHALVGSEWNGKITAPTHSRIYYIPKGSATITWQDGALSFSPGKWYLVPAGCSFDFCAEAPTEQYYVHLKLCSFDETDLLSSFRHPIEFDFDMLSEEGLSYFINSEKTTDLIAFNGIIYTLLATLLESCNIDIASADYSPCVYKAISYIKQHLSGKINIDDIASYAFVSKSSLTKKFKTEVGVPINRYVTDLIMHEAEKLLVSTNMPVSKISERLGFTDQFYFSRKFKNYFDASPSDYRKNVRFQ